MLDYRFIQENIELVQQNIANRFVKADARLVTTLIEKRNSLLQLVEAARNKRRILAAQNILTIETEKQAVLAEGKELKNEISILETQLASTEAELIKEAKKIPNMAHPDSPIGREEKDNVEVGRVGKVPSFSFTPKDHVQLGQLLDIVDFETATKVSGPKFFYLKNKALLLELSLIRYVLDILQKNGYTLYGTPDIARTAIVEGIGFNPRGKESNVYNLAEEDSCLIGTAEITLGGYYSNCILNQVDLPIKMAGLSHCFRREAGAAGQYSKGLYRVHQFTKVEAFILCLPDSSPTLHQELLHIEKEIFTNLGIPFRIVETCTGDLGAPAYRKWDLEAWMPGRNDWGEITSTSNCTDYQSRRLAIRYKDEKGKNSFVHMLNGTAIACPRAIIAILENYQQQDGSVIIPDALVPYCGFSEIKVHST